MLKSVNQELLVSLDIGTSKIISLVGEIINKNINIIGIGICKSQGIDKNGINNFDALVNCIKKCIQKSEKSANCKITSVLLSISHESIHSTNEKGMIPLSQKEITSQDIEKVIHTAKTVQIKKTHEIIHIIPQEFIIDNKSGIKNPLGMSGMRMETNVHLITCSKEIIKNLKKAVEKIGIYVNQVIFSGLASSQSVLTDQEKQFGSCMIDIGGDNIDITIYFANSLAYSKVIPYAGNTVTQDIAYAFSISNEEAEKIKIKYGTALEYNMTQNELIDIYNINGEIIKKITQQKLSEVIEARYTELLCLIKQQILIIQENRAIKNQNYEIRGGIILTGGGANINSLISCAKKIFYNFPIRIGIPHNVINKLNIEITQPEYSTVIGLLFYNKDRLKKINAITTSHFSSSNFLYKINNWIKKKINK
ncbi:cell division protein FtsA [Buchnera aphidicola (Thelaxes californica)]|uniref:Cell division protein FtsA n=1 Tax=Buchnera aphidicola (Thelaxes californica) TaxID=1315998 RepID=A0A4D6YNT3_9GAMM|nr:cell division protein FtsA [Buchnera aphidicola]QCI26715.1 cell division protein FtsA [Buchnera aphidicola (Thelaxes californica)]